MGKERNRRLEDAHPARAGQSKKKKAAMHRKYRRESKRRAQGWWKSYNHYGAE